MTRYSRRSRLYSLLAGAVLLAALTPLFSLAQPLSVALTITNNTSGEIRHVYLATPGADNWGPDQLDNSAIVTGGTYTLNISCTGSETKVIAEDQDGCFYYQVLSCSENSSWTINGDSVRDCGN